MKKYGLPKTERIKSRREVKLLFEGKIISIDVYPLKVLYRWEELAEGEKPVAKIMVSVPHKRIKRAVKRNLIKRRVREAYRLNKEIIAEKVIGRNQKLLIAFVYVSSSVKDFDIIKKAVITALTKIANHA